MLKYQNVDRVTCCNKISENRLIVMLYMLYKWKRTLIG